MTATPTEDTAARVDANSSLGMAAALLAVSTWGVSSVVAKHVDMGGLAVGVYRFMIYAAIVGTVVSVRGSRPTLRVMRSSMPGGIALGLDIALFFSAIKLTTVANATVIGALQPIVVAAVSFKVFGEQIKRSDMALAGVAIVGVGVVMFGAADAPEWSIEGDALAVGALFAWAAYFVFSKRTAGIISPTEYTLGASIWAGLINVPLALAFGQSLAWPTNDNLVWLLAMAVGSGVLGHTAMNWSIQQIPLWLSSTFTLLVPVVSAATAWIFLDESLGPLQILAMAVVLLALAGVITGQGSIGSRPRPLRR